MTQMIPGFFLLFFFDSDEQRKKENSFFSLLRYSYRSHHDYDFDDGYDNNNYNSNH